MAAAKYAIGSTVYCGGRKGKVVGTLPGDKSLLRVTYDGDVHVERIVDLSSTKKKAKK